MEINRDCDPHSLYLETIGYIERNLPIIDVIRDRRGFTALKTELGVIRVKKRVREVELNIIGSPAMYFDDFEIAREVIKGLFKFEEETE